MQNGIDVASVNGRVDWEQVKAAGIDFAIIRAGWTFYEGGLEEDRLFAQNMAQAAATGRRNRHKRLYPDLPPQPEPCSEIGRASCRERV